MSRLYNTMLRTSRLLVSAILLASLIAFPVNAQQQTESGQINVSGEVAGPPPSQPPTIDSPTTGTTFDQKNITVTGSCIAGLVVKIFRNSIFAGSGLCQSNGTYSINIDLVEDRNDLIARQYNIANQSSPDSNLVIVYFLPVDSQPSLPGDNTGSSGSGLGQQPGGGGSQVAQFQLVINYDYTQQGIFVGQAFRLPVSFVGGFPPYAVSVTWGDGESSVFSRENTDQFDTEHIYQKPGFYTVTIKVSDKDGNSASLQFVVLVNGKPEAPNPWPFLGLGANFSWPLIIFSGLIGIVSGIIVGLWIQLGVRSWLAKRLARRKKSS